MTANWTVVLDDDPTGTQGLSGIPVVISPSPETVEWAFRSGPVVYFLTNTRSMSPEAASITIDQAVDLSNKVARQLGGEVQFISRGDSTLRGHFPLEVLRVIDKSEDRFDGCLLVPAFPAAGRLTIDGVHVVSQNGIATPIAETEFAQDATFGFSVSSLTTWASERVPAHWAVVEIPSATFDNGVDELIDTLSSQNNFTVFCPSIRNGADLVLLAEAHRAVERSGRQIVTHAAPAYAAVLAGLDLTNEVAVTIPDGHGLIVVGSHTAKTTAQLADVVEQGTVAQCELDVHRIGGNSTSDEIDHLVDCAMSRLANSHVVVATSRDVRTGETPAGSLQIAGTIAGAVSEATRRIVGSGVPFVIAKGGITSHDVLEKSLGWGAATVVGPLLEGTLPVLRGWKHAAGDAVAIVFPGNVGDSQLLSRALRRLDESAMSKSRGA